jgi:nicotinate-nucleotide pyrophosphorylase (carboxylating)
MSIESDRISYEFPWETIDCQIERWLDEDVGRGDVTTDLLPLKGVKITAELLAKSSGVVAGIGGFMRILKRSDPELVVEKVVEDGSSYKTGDILVRVTGDARKLLHTERTALNLVNHLSGIATLTAEFVKEVEGTDAKIVDTRKTAPGLRALEKYAVMCGGGSNHRMDLAASIMLKDNHMALVADDLEETIEHLRKRAGHTVVIEVEVDDIDMVERAATAGADIVMLDNMTPDDGREAVQLVGDSVLVEASGGITLENVREWAECGVDIISVGVITHSAPSADLSVEFIKPGGEDG